LTVIVIHFFIRTRGSLRTFPEEQIFAVKIMYKIAASATQLANCNLLHAYSRKLAAPSGTSPNKKFHVANKLA